MVTIKQLDTFDADRLHRKLHNAWRCCNWDHQEHLARRYYRMMSRVYLHLHKALLANAAG
jgi:hypothetical protein